MYESIPDLLTRAEAQAILRISKNKMLELIHQHLLPARIIAGSFRIEKNDLIEFIEKSAYYN